MISREELKKEFIAISANRLLNEIKILRDYARRQGLIHSQEYIDFEDELNKISTMDPEE